MFVIIFMLACTLAIAQNLSIPKLDSIQLDSIKLIEPRANADTIYNDDDFTRPDFPGGLKCFYIYLSKTIHYPPSAVKAHILGKVILNFSIEQDGSIGDIKVIKGVSKDLDAEAIRVLKNSPKWIPGTHHKRPDVVRYTIPMSFQLPGAVHQKLHEDTSIYTTVEHEPEFPGGKAAFSKYLWKNVHLSKIASNESIQTKLILEIIIEKDGCISRISILKNTSPKVDEQSLQILKNSPRWKPGMIKNKPVRVRYKIPMIIELQEGDQ